VHHSPIQRIHNSQPLLHTLRQIIRRLARHPLGLTLKLKLVDDVSEIMVVLVFQVGNEVLE
jgi:hypothetical protein